MYVHIFREVTVTYFNADCRSDVLFFKSLILVTRILTFGHSMTPVVVLSIMANGDLEKGTTGGKNGFN